MELATGLAVATFAVLVGLILWLVVAQPSRHDLEKLDEALGHVLGDLRDRLEAIDALAELLPALVPSVNLVNQNPLENIFQFIQMLRGDPVGSNESTALRDVDGRFTDAPTEEEDNPPTVEAEGVID